MKVKQILILTSFVTVSATYSQNSAGSSDSFGFIENKGQLIDQNKNPNKEVLYLLPASSHANVQLKKTGFAYDLYQFTPDHKQHPKSGQLIFSRLDIEFINANPLVEIIPMQSADDYLNYYTTGITNNIAYQTNHYQKILYSNLYPGIDLIFYADPQTGVRVKYDFIIHPGADLSQVKLKYTGFETVSLENGALNFSLGNTRITENIPASWWQESGAQTAVRYDVNPAENGELIVGFKLENNFAPNHQTLVIDPEPALNWATYYGDTLTDIGTGIITDNLGFIYATGVTQSFTTLATSGVHQDTLAGGLYDVYVVKFEDDATRLWSTYYGGTGWEESRAIMVDTLDNISITGFTDSPDGIASDSAYLENINPGTIDAFIAKFDNSGLRIWSTYFGGEGDDFGNGIDTDFDGFIFVTGSTENSNSGIASSGAFQPNSNGLTDAFVVKFDTLGYPMWSTYFGGSDVDIALAVSEEIGTVIISGKTSSPDLTTTAGAHQDLYSGNQDGFMAAFSSSGALKWSTFFGGSEPDAANDVEVFNSKIYLVGETQSISQIADVGAWSENLSGGQDAFLAYFDTSGIKIWSTYYGASDIETCVGVSIELDGGIYITGSTFSDSLATSGAYDTTYNGSTDVYLAKFYAIGSLEWCSYFGASGNDVVAGLDVYGNTSIYLTGYTNSTDSISTSIPFFQPDYGGGIYDAFISRFTTYKSTPPCTVGPSGSSGFYFCEGDTIYISTLGGSLGTGANWVWYEGGCGPFLGTQIYIGDVLAIAPPLGTTTFYVRAESINNSSTCGWVTIHVIPKPVASISLNDSICPGETLILNGSGGIDYAWSGPDNFYSDLQNPTIDSITQVQAGTYYLTVDNNVCTDTDTAEFFVHAVPLIAFSAENPTCGGGNDGLLQAIPSGASPFTFFWPSNGSTNDSITNLSEGIYYVTVSDSNNCAVTDSVYITDPSLTITGILSTPAFCYSPTGTATVSTSGVNTPYTFLWSYTGDTVSTVTNLYPGWYNISVTNSLGCLETDSVYVDSLNNLSVNASVLQDETCVNFSDGSAFVQVNSGTPPYDFWWSPTGENTALIDSLSPGDYLITVIDSNSCKQIDTIHIFSAVPIVISLENSQDPTCGAPNGFLEVSASGGNGPFQYFWTPSNQFGALVSGLDSGLHTVTVTDATNCNQSANFSLYQLGIFDVSLEADELAVHEGDSTQLTVLTNPADGIFYYSWSPEINCIDCSSIQVTPVTNTNYTVYVTNAFGCVDTATILISVIPCIDPFVPTIFSPNGDGLNDEWLIFGSCIVTMRLQVYDRWGEVIFTSTDQNQPWDGTYKNQTVPVGNYTYQLELRLKDNSIVSESGLITVAN